MSSLKRCVKCGIALLFKVDVYPGDRCVKHYALPPDHPRSYDGPEDKPKTKHPAPDKVEINLIWTEGKSFNDLKFDIIRQMFAAHNGNVTWTAKSLNVSIRMLRNYLNGHKNKQLLPEPVS